MRNLLTIIAIVVFTLNVNAQTNEYAVLTPAFNFPSKGGTNQIAETYAQTGNLPQGWYTKTAQQICDEYGKEKMWVKYKQAASVNTEVNGGHYANPAEIFLFTPNHQMNSAKTCGNYIEDVQFVGKPQTQQQQQSVIVYNNVQKVDMTEVKSFITDRTTEVRQDIKRLDDNNEFRHQKEMYQLQDNRNAIAANYSVVLDNNKLLKEIQSDVKKTKTRTTIAMVTGFVNTGLGIYNAVKPNRNTVHVNNLISTVGGANNGGGYIPGSTPVTPENDPNNGNTTNDGYSSGGTN